MKISFYHYNDKGVVILTPSLPAILSEAKDLMEKFLSLEGSLLST